MMVKQTAPYLDSLRAIDLELLSADRRISKEERVSEKTVSSVKVHKICSKYLF